MTLFNADGKVITPEKKVQTPGIITGQHSVMKPSGHITIVDIDGRTEEADTLQCCHCGAHWRVKPGSGKKRGYCMKCNSVTCGRGPCNACEAYKKLFNE